MKNKTSGNEKCGRLNKKSEGGRLMDPICYTVVNINGDYRGSFPGIPVKTHLHCVSLIHGTGKPVISFIGHLHHIFPVLHSVSVLVYHYRLSFLTIAVQDNLSLCCFWSYGRNFCNLRLLCHIRLRSKGWPWCVGGRWHRRIGGR